MNLDPEDLAGDLKPWFKEIIKKHLTAWHDEEKDWYPASEVNVKQLVLTRVPHKLDKIMSVQDYLKQYFNKERMRPDSPWAFFLIRDVVDSTTEGETPEHTPIQKNPYTKQFGSLDQQQNHNRWIKTEKD